MAYYGWAPYVPVAVRRQNAVRRMNQLRKKGLDVQPVEITGRRIATTFWGQAWCDHIESFHDFENRLPRGRTYVRNGSVCHLAIKKGAITALVSGSEIYKIDVEINRLPKAKWQKVKQQSAGQIGSLLELLEGRLSDRVMQVVTDPAEGLFPLADEIRFRCNCFDWATMCKHVAAVLYGVGSRLDQQPELLFLLRGVKHEELVLAPAERAIAEATGRTSTRRTLAGDQLAGVFGIDLETDSDASTAGGIVSPAAKSPRAGRRAEPAGKKTAKKKGAARSAGSPSKKTTKKASAKSSAGQSARSPKGKAAKKPARKKTASAASATRRSARRRPRVSE